jgi:hypothetical protein
LTSVTLSAPLHAAPDDLEAAFAYAYERGWTDGLPIIPPTPERVQRMLAAVDRDPSEVVAELPPRNGVATVERIAINAVMAGCLPEYLPVLIAAAKAVGNPEFNLHGIQCTTNSMSPMLVVNGPIRHQIGMNAGRNCLGPGVRANATIGRALRFLLQNVGGGIPGEIDKATHGMPGKYTMCLAEDEEESAWEPLHVERGFRADQSTVTAIGVNGTKNVSALYETGESVLVVLADALARISAGGANEVLLLPSGYTRQMTEAGYSKAQAREYLWEHGKIPVSRFPKGSKIAPNMKRRRGEWAYPAARPEGLILICTGGPEPYHATIMSSFSTTDATTIVIEQPA